MEANDLMRGLQQTEYYGVLVDPLLVNAFSADSFGDTYRLADELADTLYREYANLKHFSGLPDVPYSLSMTRWCLVETLLSTAMKLAYQRTGQILPTKAALVAAETNLRSFIDHEGVETLYTTYYGVVGHDVLQPFVHYREIALADYFNGSRHHPYPEQKLDVVLLIALYRRVLRMRVGHRQRTVSITRTGLRTFDWMHECLVESGYLQRRYQLSHLYQFGAVRGWDDLDNHVWPTLNEVRSEYVQWLHLRPDKQILEVGCGTGALTLDAGLFHEVQDGTVTAIDVSPDMLAQAKSKQKQFSNPGNVKFQLASAERLPYSENYFDDACGSLFLNFVNPHKTLREMRRVTKPGGTVSALQVIRFDTIMPFFRDWFEPVLELVESNSSSGRTYLPTVEELVQWFEEGGFSQLETKTASTSWVFDNPEIVVQHRIQDIGFLQRPLIELSWDDRNTIIAELIDRGRDVCSKYTLAQRTVTMKVLMIRGRKPQL